MSRPRGAAPVGVVLASVALAAALLGLSPTLNPVDAVLGRGAVVEVPDLTGRTQPVAEAEARSLGLVPRIRSAFSLTVRRGSVIAQEPRAGSRIREGTDLTLVVSRGANRVPMPDAVGQPFRAVTRELRAADIPLAVERVASEDAPAGVVISQRPGPGVVVTGDDRPAFTVSRGADPRPVPGVTGLLLEGAAFQLGKAGLAIGPVTPLDDATVPVGAVIATDPVAGTVVDKDTPVALTVSQGPPPVQLPDLVGLAQAQATADLERLGLVANPVSENQGVALSGGPVVAQSPEARTPLRAGAVVTITIGAGR
jgi:serine/threonine-protein kinase